MDCNQMIQDIATKAHCMRCDIMEMGYAAGKQGGHFGPALSCADMVAALFFGVMHHDVNHPQMATRDRFVLSKGHACLAYYAALVEAGYIPKEDMKTFKGNNGYLCGHPSMNMKYGIELSSGSLGNGFSIACGMAQAAKLKGETHRVFCILGDGECNEGVVMESMMNASKYQLDNLVAIVDINGFQLSGTSHQVMPVDLEALWRALGWSVHVLDDGNDVEAVWSLLQTIASTANKRPSVILAKTVKGKGIPFMEHNLAFHATPINQEQYHLAMEALQATRV